MKIILRILLILALILAVAVIAILMFYFIENKTNGKITSSGEQRKYLLYVPPSYNPENPTPLVISLHGFAQWPANQMETSRWNTLADEHGFIVVYPSGVGFPLRWRAYGETGGATDTALDIAFISDLIDKLQADYNIDPGRVYVNGMSNGGGMTFTLSCALSERIAAIGLVAGAYALPWSECSPSRPVPAIVFHGDADAIVPYNGTQGNSSRFDLPDIPTWVQEYARRNGCASDPVELAPVASASAIQYTACTADAGVIFYTIAGGGHSWPGGKPLPRLIVGHTTQDIDASRLMWEFFQEHALSRNLVNR